MPHRNPRRSKAPNIESHKLDRRITIQTVTKSTDSEYGEAVETYADWATVWASVTPWQMKEFNLAGQISAEVDTRFHIRYLSGMTPTMKIVYDGKTYDIYKFEEVGRHDRMNIFAKARQE
jgi:SPP1 family predicted phage head-tail adaptor